MEVNRIETLQDQRFREEILKQHGAFLADGKPCEVEITGLRSARISCPEDVEIDALIDEFRYYAEHITEFYDESGNLIRSLPPVELFEVELDRIQPSQFYVDTDKLNAVSDFVSAYQDIVVPLNRDGENYISLDGHTRMALAVRMGFDRVLGFITEDSVAYEFVEEARRRGVRRPQDLAELSHEEYAVKWHKFCDDFFAKRKDDQA